jgi:CBS-domain-containing membrane protein
MRACDIMSGPVVTVSPGTAVKDAAKLLAAHGFTALPVVDADGGLIGIITEADVVRGRFPHDPRYRITDAYDRVVDDQPRVPPATVGEVMTTPAIGMGAGTDVVDLVSAMLSDRIRCIPIVDGSRVVGIVTRQDLVRALARDDQTIARDVRHQLSMYGGAQRWTVEVADGVATICDEFDSTTDAHVAAVLAEAVPGVTAVRMTTHSAGT